MCESTIILESNEGSEEIMKDVIKVYFKNDIVICTDLIGERKELTDVRILEIDSLKHVIVLEKISD